MSQTDAMECRACGRNERASEGYPCRGCGTFICVLCNLRGTLFCQECAAKGLAAERPTTERPTADRPTA
jgi:hypothetical protein